MKNNIGSSFWFADATPIYKMFTFSVESLPIVGTLLQAQLQLLREISVWFTTTIARGKTEARQAAKTLTFYSCFVVEGT